MQFDTGVLYVVIGISTCSPNTFIKLNIKDKIVKSVKYHVISGIVSYKSGLIYKILGGMNTSLYINIILYYNTITCLACLRILKIISRRNIETRSYLNKY
jgi:hypothetical protein